MKIQLSLAVLSTTLLTGAYAAPLFPDVGQDHWASQAVQKLAAHGLIEGYRDGTFKGDRATSRYEMALLVARVWQVYEQNRATWASQEDLELLRKLMVELRTELEALGGARHSGGAASIADRPTRRGTGKVDLARQPGGARHQPDF